ncbi:MAG: GNAT family N-acetyltransferase [Dehalococcoidia bacterium]|nr:GNAT family N-acetyltransferase [Dehalococcoidia bacterium]|tara:strand:+ start:736 stop:1191 length:456 start_codon:yes stop_codon:yes gene_type:complete
MVQISIREGSISDTPTISRFQQQMALETESKILKESTIRKGVESVLKCPNKGFYIIAETDSQIIGSLLVTFEWSDWRNGWFFWIQSVFVDAKYRRQGVYRVMHSEVIRRTKASGNCCGIRLYVEKDNRNAQKVYKTLGMHETDYYLYEEEF